MAWLEAFFRLFRRRRPAGRSLLSLDSIADVPIGGLEPMATAADADLVLPPPPPSLEAAGSDLRPVAAASPASPPSAERARELDAEPEPASPPVVAEPPATQVLSFAPAHAYALEAPTIELEDDEEIRDFEEEADAQVDPLDDDGRASLDVRLLDALAQTPQRREAARALALEGVHRIALTDAAGPGSLAEALIALEAEGRVICTVAEDGGEPHLRYEPAPASTSGEVGSGSG